MCTPIHTVAVAAFEFFMVGLAVCFARRNRSLGMTTGNDLSQCQDLRSLQHNLRATRWLSMLYVPLFLGLVLLAPTKACELSADTVVSPANIVVWAGWFIAAALALFVAFRTQALLWQVQTEMIHRQLATISDMEDDDDEGPPQQEMV